MSHFVVLVAADDEEQLDTMLLPYDENSNSSEPKWDWWMIGGRWSGFLKLNEELEESEGGHLEVAGLVSPSVPPRSDTEPSGYNWAPVSCVDWEGMRQAESSDEVELYELYHRLRQEVADEGITDNALNQARPDFLEAQARGLGEDVSLTQFVCNRRLHRALVEHGHWLMDSDREQELKLARPEFMALANAKALTFAFIDTEGHWYERAEMGWWALTRNHQEGYDKAFWQFVEGLLVSNSDQRLYIIDAHI